jgi:hypothetical protein
MDEFHNMGVFEHPEQHPREIAYIRQKLAELKGLMAQEKTKALRKQALLGLQTATTRQSLQEQGRFENMAAEKALEEIADKNTQMFFANGDYAAVDDLDQWDIMLNNKMYVKHGEADAKREEEKLKASGEGIRNEMEQLKDEEPGILETIWSVVGWDDFGDFLIDAALTVGTAGAGKVARGAYKAKKARKIAHARKAIRMARRMKRVQKVKQLGEAAKTAVTAIKKDPGKVKDMAQWVLENSSSVGRKIITDFIANSSATATTGKDQSQSSVITARPRKEYIQYMVDQYLGLNSDLAKDYVQMMFWAYATGRKDSGNRLLHAFLSVALKRRGLANLIHSTINYTGKLDFPDSVEDLKATGVDIANTAVSTAGEMLQDFVMALPYFDEYKSILEPMIETARKTLVNLIRTEIGN